MMNNYRDYFTLDLALMNRRCLRRHCRIRRCRCRCRWRQRGRGWWWCSGSISDYRKSPPLSNPFVPLTMGEKKLALVHLT